MQSNIIRYGNRTIAYSVIHSNRKTLGIIVTPDKRVIVRCPLNARREKVHAVIQKRLKWISEKLSFFESLSENIPERRYVSGEAHFYLGKQYRLKVVKSKAEEVKLIGPYIFVYTLKGNNRKVVEILLDYWYKEKALKYFYYIVKKWMPTFKKYNIPEPVIVIKKMKKRWGSCNTKNKIIVNQDLIKTPSRCISYLIVHELCHLIHRDHNSEFYYLLSKILPDWNKTKSLLDNFGVKVIS